MMWVLKITVSEERDTFFEQLKMMVKKNHTQIFFFNILTNDNIGPVKQKHLRKSVIIYLYPSV